VNSGAVPSAVVTFATVTFGFKLLTAVKLSTRASAPASSSTAT